MSCSHHVKEDTDEYYIVSSHMFQMAELVCTILTSKDYRHLKLQMSKKLYSRFSLSLLNSFFLKKIKVPSDEHYVTRFIITQHFHCIRCLTKYRKIPLTRHSAKHVKQLIQLNKQKKSGMFID